MKWIKTFESFESVDLSNPSKILFGEIKLGSQAAEEYFNENPNQIESIIDEITKQTPESQIDLSKFVTDFRGREVEIRQISKSTEAHSVVSQLLQKIQLSQSLIDLIVRYVQTIQSVFSGTGFLFMIGIAISCLSIAISKVNQPSPDISI